MALVDAPTCSPQQTSGTEVPAVQCHAAFLCVEHTISFCYHLFMRTAYGAAYLMPSAMHCHHN